MHKRLEIRISGLGGQGVVLAGEILGRAAVYDGKNVVQTQSYGAEARGTAARSEIIVSDDAIWFPFVRRCDVLVAMSRDALDQYLGDLKDGGVLLVDWGLVKDVPEVNARVFRVPATEVAERKLGLRICANVVMLGALLKVTGVVSFGALEKAVVESVPEKAKDVNLRALKIGFGLI